MDSSLRNTAGLTKRIDHLRDELIRHFESLVSLAAVEKSDRNMTALAEYQMRVESAALVKAAQDVTTLVRLLQEMWLFGKLNTLGEYEAQKQCNEMAKRVGEMLPRFLGRDEADSLVEAIVEEREAQLDGLE